MPDEETFDLILEMSISTMKLTAGKFTNLYLVSFYSVSIEINKELVVYCKKNKREKNQA